MKQRGFKVLMTGMSAAVWMLVSAGVIAGYLNWAKYEPAFVVLNASKHWARLQNPHDPKAVIIYREFRVNREREFLIIRQLIQGTDTEAVLRIELPTTVVNYSIGDYATERIVEVPTLKPGRYIMMNRVCWKPNILRSDCVDLPRLDLIVPTP